MGETGKEHTRAMQRDERLNRDHEGESDERREERIKGNPEHSRTRQSSQRGGSAATESLPSRLASSLNEPA